MYMPGKKSIRQGKVMVGFYLIAGEHKKIIPRRSIYPRSIEGFLQIGCIGLRNAIPSLDLFPLRSISFVYNIDGDTHNPPRTKRVPIKEGTCNVLESTTVNFRIPLDPMFTPVLSIFVYDNYLGAFAQRCLGMAAIDLAIPIKALFAKKGKGEAFVIEEKEPESTSQYRDPEEEEFEIEPVKGGIQKMVKKLAPQPVLQQETKMIKHYLPPKVTHYIYIYIYIAPRYF